MENSLETTNVIFLNLIVAFGERKDLYSAQFGHAVNPNA
jgi:hypothetical protein